jgi:riboflavin kinase / FMN adenylyltransferase
MQLLTSFSQKLNVSAPIIFTFGSFDGVHLGHQHIFDLVESAAKEVRGVKCALTFSNHPIEVLFPETQIEKLTSTEHKIRLLEPFFDYLLVLPFTKELQALSARAFLDKIREVMPFSHIVVGSDVAFGKNREGNLEQLQRYGTEYNFSCSFSERIALCGTPVSSSHIRFLIKTAQFDEARRFLARSYSHYLPLLDGTVDLSGYVFPPDGKYLAKIKLKKDEGWKDSLVYLKGNKLKVDIAPCVHDPFIEIQYVDGPL